MIENYINPYFDIKIKQGRIKKMINYKYVSNAVNKSSCEIPKYSPIYFDIDRENYFKEEWREITPNIIPYVREHCYWISSHGRLFSTISSPRHLNGSFLNTSTNSKGYKEIYLFTSEGSPTYRLTRKLHRVVLMMFRYIPGCEFLEVDHINGDKSLNYLYNLDWVTNTNNDRRKYIDKGKITYPIEEGLFLMENDFDDIFIKIYSGMFSIQELSISYGLSCNFIYGLINGYVHPESREKFFINYPNFYSNIEKGNLSDIELRDYIRTFSN